MPKRTCSVEGCESAHGAKGYCPKHYQRWVKYGDPLVLKGREYPTRRPCSVAGCETTSYKRNLCPKHHWRWERYGDPLAEKAPRQVKIAKCLHCHEPYERRRSQQRFCTHRCATSYRLSDEYKELAAQGLKRCNDCGAVKPLGDFHLNQARSLRGGRCKVCISEFYKAHNAKPEVKARNRATQIASKYGLTVADYEARLRMQDHRCALCGRPDGHDGKRLVIDHCHATGRVRGLLCSRCNSALGYFEDDPHRIANAVAYLGGLPCSSDSSTGLLPSRL